MPIRFNVQNGMQAGEGCPRNRPQQRPECPCVGSGYEGCRRRESSQLFCLQKSLDLPINLVQFKVPLRPNEIAKCTAGQAGDNWPVAIAGGGQLRLDGNALQRLFAIKGFVRMAWLQSDDLRASRRFLGTLKQKRARRGESPHPHFWHSGLHSAQDQAYIARNNLEEIQAWGSQVWFDLEPFEAEANDPQYLVVNVRNRALAHGRTLADDVRQVLRTHCQAWVNPAQLTSREVDFDPLPAPDDLVFPFVEIRVDFDLGPFVIGMNYDSHGEQGIAADARAFPLNRVDARRNPKCVIPALRAPGQAALPVSSLRGPIREAIRWTGWLAGQPGTDPSDDLCGWTEGPQDHPARESRLCLSFRDDLSALVLAQDRFAHQNFYFTNDLLHARTNPEDHRKDFNPMQIVYCQGAQNQIVLRIHKCTESDLWLLKNALRLIHLGFFRVGRFRSRGFGRIRLGAASVTKVTDLQSWLESPKNHLRETWGQGTWEAAAREAGPGREPVAPEPGRAEAPQPIPQIPTFDWDAIADQTLRVKLQACEKNIDDTHVLYCLKTIQGNGTTGVAIVKRGGTLYREDSWEWKKPNDAQVNAEDWILGIVNGKVSEHSKTITKKGTQKIT